MTPEPRWATMRPEGWSDGLRALCEDYLNNDSVVVEIGSYAGEGTVVFAAVCRTVFAIDPWSPAFTGQMFEGCGDAGIPKSFEPSDFPTMLEVERIFDARIATSANVVKMKASSDDCVELFMDASLDLVYIDSIHTYEVVSRNISLWEPKLKPGGVMAGHDYAQDTWPGVVRAVAEAYGLPDRTFTDTSWAVRVGGNRAPASL